ncbi:MAG: DUF5693 family protein, partial [Defluviitaleaceae bacterium]|nr:DUF5693 family protein [Defluviitaleaceae bacterium]
MLKQNFGKLIVWAALLASLVAAAGSFALRVRNEQANRTVMSVADYREFNLSALNSNRGMDDVLRDLKRAGIQAIGLRELSLRDMAAGGAIEVVSLGELIAGARLGDDGLLRLIYAETAPLRQISHENLVAVSPEKDTSEFLQSRLEARYMSQKKAEECGCTPEFLRFEWNGNDYFVMNAEHTNVQKIKEGAAILDVQLGYDVAAIESITSLGLSVALCPGVSRGSGEGFWDEYEEIISKYGIKTIIFANKVFDGTQYGVGRLNAIIEKHGMIIGVVEAANQVRYVTQDGLDLLMEMGGYQVNRVYSTSNDEFVTRMRDRYFRWVRGVVDR